MNGANRRNDTALSWTGALAPVPAPAPASQVAPVSVNPPLSGGQLVNRPPRQTYPKNGKPPTPKGLTTANSHPGGPTGR